MGSGPGLDLSPLLHLHEPPPPPAAPGQAAAGTQSSETAASRLAGWLPPAAALQPLLQPTCCVAAPQLLGASAALTQAAAAHQPETPVNTNLKIVAVHTLYRALIWTPYPCTLHSVCLSEDATTPCGRIDKKACLCAKKGRQSCRTNFQHRCIPVLALKALQSDNPPHSGKHEDRYARAPLLSRTNGVRCQITIFNMPQTSSAHMSTEGTTTACKTAIIYRTREAGPVVAPPAAAFRPACHLKTLHQWSARMNVQQTGGHFKK